MCVFGWVGKGKGRGARVEAFVSVLNTRPPGCHAQASAYWSYYPQDLLCTLCVCLIFSFPSFVHIHVALPCLFERARFSSSSREILEFEYPNPARGTPRAGWSASAYYAYWLFFLAYFHAISRHIIFQALVALKLLVSLISRFVACSPRIFADTHTHTQTGTQNNYSATDYKIPKHTFLFIECSQQYDMCYWYVLYTKMILNYH